ncbi:hypothetical protein GCM10023093_08010 [Nemorincola caseinilytica]|uniref:Lipoprotein n=1 Tax=Nemorincola caseinilytica TaxID=2054315 RepID=A0ABP8N9Z4_9BACT
MKKLFPLMVVAVAASMFTSCKKDYTCTCTITTGSTTVTQPYALGKQSKSDAKDACDKMSATYTTALSTASCKL